MKKIGLLINFIVGCAVLFAAFGIGWANWGKLPNQVIVMQTLMGALAFVVVLLVAMGVLSKGKERWTPGQAKSSFGLITIDDRLKAEIMRV